MSASALGRIAYSAGLLPASMTGASMRELHRSGIIHTGSTHQTRSRQPSPYPLADSPSGLISDTDEEAHLGLRPTSPTHISQSPSHSNGFKNAFSRLRERAPLKRRPTAVRVSEDRYDHKSRRERSSPRMIRPSANERTPLIKAGVKPDIRWTAEEGKADIGLGRMVELGLPLIM